jgi:hypothetical protein
MLRGPPDGFRWPYPWRPLADPELVPPFHEGLRAFTLEAELQREVCPGHPLYRVECRAVARNVEDIDEFIFATAKPQMPVAFVHLTWAVERSPAFPFPVAYPSWEAFRSSWADADV